jgi:hypothetical protein
MWDHRNHVLHDTEHSVRLTDPKDYSRVSIGTAGIPAEDKVHFQRGLPALLQQQPVNQTAWLIRIQAVRERAKRRYG